MRHIPRACSQTRNTLPDMPPTRHCCLVHEKVLPKAQSPDGPENYGRLKQPLSGARPREGGSHAGVREGQTVRRVLRTSPTSRVARLTEAIGVRLQTMARAVLRLFGGPSRIELHLGKGGTSDASERMQVVCRTRRQVSARGCAHGFWTDVMGGGMDAALTGVDQIEVGEQQLTSREPLNGWEWDTRTNLLARVGGHELVRSKRHILPRNDIERIRRVVGMLRTKNLPFSSTLSILPQSAALRR